MSKALPVTADQIADGAIEAAKAGAAILHLHARDPQTGKPSQDPDLFRPFLQKIKANTYAVVNITAGGSPHMTVEERMRPAMTFKPEPLKQLVRHPMSRPMSGRDCLCIQF